MVVVGILFVDREPVEVCLESSTDPSPTGPRICRRRSKDSPRTYSTPVTLKKRIPLPVLTSSQTRPKDPLLCLSGVMSLESRLD